MNDFGGVAQVGTANVLAFLFGLVVLAVLHKKKFKAAVVIAMLTTTLLSFLMTWTLPSFENSTSVGTAFGDWWSNTWGSMNFRFDLAFIDAKMIFTSITLIITFCLVDMFDTIGTLYGTASQANLLDKDGNPLKMQQCMLCDSIATFSGAFLGASTVTTFVESSAGVSVGGRTGLTSIVVAALFAVSLFFVPFASMIPNQAVAIALVFVGVCMMKGVKDIDFSDITIAIPAFLTFIMMPLTYSIADGIAVGLITYTLIKLASLKFTKKDIVPASIALLFVVKYTLTAFL